MFNWKLTIVISPVPILLSSRELLEIPYFMAPEFSRSRSVALVSPMLTTLAAARRQYPCRCKYHSNPSCFHIIPFLSDLYPCECLAFLLQSGNSFYYLTVPRGTGKYGRHVIFLNFCMQNFLRCQSAPSDF